MREEWFDDPLLKAAAANSHRHLANGFTDWLRMIISSHTNASATAIPPTTPGFELTALAGLDVEQHDDEERKAPSRRPHRPEFRMTAINGIQQREQPSHEHKQQDQKHRAGDGVAIGDH